MAKGNFWSYTTLGALWINDKSEILRFVTQKLQYEDAAVELFVLMAYLCETHLMIADLWGQS